MTQSVSWSFFHPLQLFCAQSIAVASMSGGWNTIESDAVSRATGNHEFTTDSSGQGVFTSMIETLGVQGVQFEELIDLDEDYLAQLQYALSIPLPPPALTARSPYGVIFLFRYPTSPAPPSATDPISASTTGQPSPAAASHLFFARQTIQNACGTQALISILLNKDSTIDIGPTLRDFKEFTFAFPPDLRGEALSNADPIRAAHNAFARAAPFADETAREVDPEDADLYHFIAYVGSAGTLWELDGLQEAPISHGPLPDSNHPNTDDGREGAAGEAAGEAAEGTAEDGGDASAAAFARAVIPVLRQRIARYPASEIRFNLLALTRDPRAALRAAGDAEGLAREARRRAAWGWEDALRRHNLVGFTGEVLRGVVGGLVRTGGGGGGEAAYRRWVADGVARTRERGERERGRRRVAKGEARGG